MNNLNKFKSKKKVFFQKLKPYKEVFYFLVILLISNFFWKFAVKGDDSDTLISFLGLNVTAPFNFVAQHFTNAVSSVLHFFGSDVIQRNNILSHNNEYNVHIVWSCTGIKQAYIFSCIIAFTRGFWMKKIWYIPAGLLVVYLFNLLRLTVIVASVKNHFEWFDFLHSYLFKYLFYGAIFVMWILWNEKIAVKKSPSQQQSR